MKTIITVVGKDKVGIIYNVCKYLSEENINVLDISQTIVNDYFNMLMIVDTQASLNSFEVINENIQSIAKELGVVITVQREDIFVSMHRL
ncbi:MAG: ACT domain-containing protein [Erysipelothrix sp.]